MYNESEDAYYIRNAGADTGLKKLGNPSPNMYLWTSSPVDIKAIMPDIYSKLTREDFSVGSGYVYADCSQSGGFTASGGASCTHSYNQSTGILTFSGISGIFAPNNDFSFLARTKLSSSGTFAVYRGTIAGVAQ